MTIKILKDELLTMLCVICVCSVIVHVLSTIVMNIIFIFRLPWTTAWYCDPLRYILYFVFKTFASQCEVRIVFLIALLINANFATYYFPYHSAELMLMLAWLKLIFAIILFNVIMLSLFLFLKLFVWFMRSYFFTCNNTFAWY